MSRRDLRSMAKRRRDRWCLSPLTGQAGFTLLEVAIVAGLFSVVGLAVISTLSGGAKIWQRVYAKDLTQQVSVFFEEMVSDVRNTVHYESVPFEGDEDKLSFPTVISSFSNISGLKRGIGQVIYAFDEDARAVRKITRNSSHIFKEEDGVTEEILGDVDAVTLLYYRYDTDQKKFVWSNEWDEQNVERNSFPSPPFFLPWL